MGRADIMVMYGQRYYPYAKLPSKGARFGAGFVNELASALERRNQQILEKREQEREAEVLRQQRLYETYHASIENPYARPSDIVQMQQQMSALNIPHVKYDPLMAAMARGEQLGVAERERKMAEAEHRQGLESGRARIGLIKAQTEKTKQPTVTEPEKPARFTPAQYDRLVQEEKFKVELDLGLRIKNDPEKLYHPDVTQEQIDEAERQARKRIDKKYPDYLPVGGGSKLFRDPVATFLGYSEGK
jgi:hypothetical protein